MKTSKFTDPQKAFVVKQGEDGTSVAEICRKAGISQAIYFCTVTPVQGPSTPSPQHQSFLRFQERASAQVRLLRLEV
ncbi:transposase [Qipengyuania sp. ASV99]|uniref:transposase n=1 Tax=Qipengyuania sp. ASV99 TaxID=3399681 RepID=UPI003A4C5740